MQCFLHMLYCAKVKRKWLVCPFPEALLVSLLWKVSKLYLRAIWNINALLLGIVTLIINIPIRSMVTKLMTKYTEHNSKPNHSDNSLCSNHQTCFSHKNANLLYCGVCCWKSANGLCILWIAEFYTSGTKCPYSYTIDRE